MNLRANPTTKFSQFSKFEARLVPKLMRATETGSAAVLEISQELCPVLSGDLRSSGRYRVEWVGTRILGYVEYTAHHAAFVEFGTGITGRGTYPFNLPVVGVPITGMWVYDYKQQQWVGMQASPYLRPALDTGRPRILAAYSEILGI